MGSIVIEKGTISDPKILLTEVMKVFNANPELIDSVFAASETAVSTVQADGETTGTTNFTSALSDFVTDTVAVDDYVTILKTDEKANLGRWRVTAITDLNTLVLDSNLTVDTVMSFTVDRGKLVRHQGDDQNIYFT